MKKYLILFILFDAEVSFGDLVGRVIENIHKQRRRRTVFPGMVAKGFSQRMAAYMIWEVGIDSSLFDDAKSLVAADWQIAVLLAGKQGLFPGSLCRFQSV